MQKIKFFQSQQFGLGLLLLVMVIWGTTFPLMKDAITTISPSALAAGRFAIAAVVLLPFMQKIYPQLIRDGIILGIIFFLTLFTQLKALETIPANRAAFICAFNVVLVPLLSPWFHNWLGNNKNSHRQSSPPIQSQKWTAPLIALVGLGIMCGGVATWSIGDLWMLLCALTFALYLLYIELVSRRHTVMALTGMQLLVVAVISLGWAVPTLGSQVGAIASHWWLLVYLGIVVSILSTCIQTIAQRLISAQDTALMCTLEPVFAAIFAFFLLGEQMSLHAWLGAGVVLIAMCQSQDLLPILVNRAFKSNY